MSVLVNRYSSACIHVMTTDNNQCFPFMHMCVKDVQKHILCLSFEVCFSKYDADIFTSDFLGGWGGGGAEGEGYFIMQRNLLSASQ